MRLGNTVRFVSKANIRKKGGGYEVVWGLMFHFLGAFHFSEGGGPVRRISKIAVSRLRKKRSFRGIFL